MKDSVARGPRIPMNKASEEGRRVSLLVAGSWGLLLGYGAFSFASFVSGSLDLPGSLSSPHEEVLGRWHPALNQAVGSLR